MNDPTDNDLRESFSRLRQQDRAIAPAWQITARHQPDSPPPRKTRPILCWVIALACLALLFSIGRPGSPQGTVGDLGAELPELFTPQGAPLFSSLAFDTPSLPSDALLPPHLTIQLP
jgi:hypothetical protein